MDYRHFTLIEKYFELGEIIEKNTRVIEILNRTKDGFISLIDLMEIRNELSSLGLLPNDYVNISELIEALEDEIAQLKHERNNLKQISLQMNIDLEHIMLQKQLLEVSI